MYRSTALALCLALAAPLAGLPAGAETLNVQRGETSTLELAKDSAVVVESESPFSELTIANPAIADISTLSDRAIYVLGKEPGRTTLMMLNATGEVMTIVNIQVTPDIAEFRERLTQILPGEAIEARTANDGIVLTGTASSDRVVQQAIELAGRYAPGRVSNLLRVDVAAAPAVDVAFVAAEVKALFPDEPIELREAGGMIVLSGTVSSLSRMEQARALAESLAPGRIRSDMTTTEVPDVAAMLAQVRAILPDEPVEAAIVGSSIVLSGRISSAEAVGQVQQIVALFAPGWSVTNLMTLRASCTVRTRRGADVVELPVPCTD